MLLQLKISNYALIRETVINFKDNLTVITGETGAGKSILLGALSLVTGSRAEVSVIKKGEKKSVVEAQFDISNYSLQPFFEENDLDYEDITTIRREILDTGKSRSFINDTPVGLNVLKDLGNFLIDIHSQHKTLEIGKENFQISVLDSVSNNKTVLEEYRDLYLKFKKKTSELQQLEQQALQAKKESEYLHFRYDELFKANLQEGEQKDLEDELEILTHNEDIKISISQSSDLIISAEEGTVLEKLKESKSELDKISAYYPPALDLSSRLDSVYIELQDIGRELYSLNENTEYSPERLDFVNSRLSLLYNLQKKFLVSSVDELIKERDSLKSKLDLVEESSDKIDTLKKEISHIKVDLSKKAELLTSNRKKSVKGLKTEIESLISSLGIKDGVFDVEFKPLTEFSSNGKDQIKFLFSANKNLPPNDLSKTASGGELSRLMLCLKYILSRSEKLPTIIFDEIDTGISGDVAGKTGLMFKKIAGFMQVICITHLPQVASFGSHHFKVYKHEENSAIVSDIRELQYEERVTEIAAMLSGEKITNAAIENARELLNN
ncbi:MAG: DNA repair protein RecN [Bacteroidales bacterium]|nr:DNA repair protein RecN [Bacteroidales bacterium]